MDGLFLGAIRRNDLNDVKCTFQDSFINERHYGMTVLHFASLYDNTGRIVEYLIRRGCSIEDVATTDGMGRWGCENGWRSTHMAACHGYKATMKVLTKEVCTLDFNSTAGETPLQVANRMNKVECAEILHAAMVKKVTPSLIDFERVSSLGSGGFGTVYKSFDKTTNIHLAMKEVTLVSSFDNELYIYAKLNCHKRIVQFFGITKSAEAMYFHMEYMAQGSIRDLLDKHGPLDHSVIARYSKQILEGLEYLHQKNIIHRDIKAANILRDDQDNVKLCDFGISRYLETISMNSVTINANNVGREVANTSCGTSYFMAPEVIRGDPYSTESDVWSLGATVIEMLTSEHPYPNLEPTNAKRKIGNTSKLEFQPPEPIPPLLQSFLNQMLIPDQQKRATVQTLLSSDFIRSVSQ